MIKTLIIEDEPAAVRRLIKLLQAHPDNFEILDKLDSIEAVLEWWHNNDAPDLIFMDIQLADGNSFEIFDHIKIKCPIIFATAYNQYATEAFQVNAVDYILKPIKKTALEKAIDRYKEQTQQAPKDYQQIMHAMLGKERPKRFMVRVGQRIKIISIKEAAYFFSRDKITYLVNFAGKKFPINVSLEKVEALLDQHSFFRINRQYIIHIEAIREMYAYSKSRVKIDLNLPSEEEIIVSTERSPHFKKWLVGEQ